MQINTQSAVRRNVELAKVIFLREFRSMYKRTALGPFWAILSPMFYVAVFIFFRLLFGLGNPEGYPMIPFLFSGLSLWMLFSVTVMAAFPALTGNAGILKKIPVSPLVFVFAGAGTPIFTFFVHWLCVEGLLIFYGYYPTIHHILIPAIALLTLLFSIGLGLMVAAIALYRQDIIQVLPSVIQLGLFATPIFFSPAIIPENLQWVVTYNPIAHCIQMFRGIIFNAAWPSPEQLLITVGAIIIVWMLGLPMFKRSTRYLADVF